MSTPGDPPPEGRLIETAREVKKLSQNKAAKLADMSGTRWRQIVTGVASGGRGIRIPVNGNAETLARMARVVGVTPEQLAEVDRNDAAAELRTLLPLEQGVPEMTTAELTERILRLERAVFGKETPAELPPSRSQGLVAKYAEMERLLEGESEPKRPGPDAEDEQDAC